MAKSPTISKGTSIPSHSQSLTTLVITVHPSVPAHTIKDLVALIKANPGKYSYASPGTGTPGHLVGEAFRLSLGLDLVHVPFNSAGPAVGSAVAGHTPICFASPSPAAQQVDDGKLRGLAVTSRTRSQALPDVPTTAEAGYPDIAGDNWQAVIVPAGTPKEIIAVLNREIVKILALPEVRKHWRYSASSRSRSTPEEFTSRAKVEFDEMGQGNSSVQYQGAMTIARAASAHASSVGRPNRRKQ